MLRKATTRGTAVIRPAVSGSAFWRRLRASPMISKFRSTACRSTRSERYWSRLCVSVSDRMKEAASRTSSRYFGASGRIEWASRLLDLADEVGIPQRTGGQKVHLATEEMLESREEAEVLVRQVHRRRLPELDEKVEIAPGGIEASCDRRAKEVEPSHPVAATDLGESAHLGFR